MHIDIYCINTLKPSQLPALSNALQVGAVGGVQVRGLSEHMQFLSGGCLF